MADATRQMRTSRLRCGHHGLFLSLPYVHNGLLGLIPTSSLWVIFWKKNCPDEQSNSLLCLGATYILQNVGCDLICENQDCILGWECWNLLRICATLYSLQCVFTAIISLDRSQWKNMLCYTIYQNLKDTVWNVPNFLTSSHRFTPHFKAH